MPRNNYYYNGELISNAKRLRKEMTRHEKHLWFDCLRTYPVKIYRQRSVAGYIADFYCASAKLVIELDGSQHFTPEGIEHDACRTAVFQQLGITVIRFTNRQIDMEFPAVCMEIDRMIQSRLNNQDANI